VPYRSPTRDWQSIALLNHIIPAPDDIVLHAAIEVCESDVMDGTTLGETWQDLVRDSHPDYGDVNKTVSPSIFMPLDLDRFLAVRVRAVSAMENWGPNVNGDAFPAKELESSHQSLIAKGFYNEHNSFDPINAMGIIAHSQWLPEDQFVVCVALIDKLLFPEEAKMVRQAFRTSKKAGVSIGCIAGSAECSICGRIATKKGEICAHMDRSHPNCVKGRTLPDSRIAFDICRNLRFYELSFTKAPADRDAVPDGPQYIQGATLLAADEAKATVKDEDIKPKKGEPKVEEVTEEKPAEKGGDAGPGLIDVKMPDEVMLNKLVDRAVNQAIKSRVNKLVKAEVDRVLGPYMRDMQVQVKPEIKEKVEEKKEEVRDINQE